MHKSVSMLSSYCRHRDYCLFHCYLVPMTVHIPRRERKGPSQDCAWRDLKSPESVRMQALHAGEAGRLVAGLKSHSVEGVRPLSIFLNVDSTQSL